MFGIRVIVNRLLFLLFSGIGGLPIIKKKKITYVHIVESHNSMKNPGSTICENYI